MRGFLPFRPLGWPVFLLMALCLVLASCGREAPYYEPGTITVTSTPAGAAIFLDGQDTGEITPHDFSGLEANRYEVSVVLAGFFPDPVSSTVDLHPAEHLSRDFVLNSEAPTALTVTSSPAGAAIMLDGTDTGEVTPATISGLTAGEVSVQLALAGHYVFPASFTATVVAHETTELPADTFHLRSKKTVMMEGFSNVDCAGCPDLAINVGNLMAQENYGLDKVLYCKFSMSWPGIDPHYQYNSTENDDRMNYYIGNLGAGIPMMTLDGAKAEGSAANSTPTASELAAMVDAALQSEPGFLVDVSADFTNTSVPVTITLTPIEDVDLSGFSLFVALVQSLVQYDEAPGSEGETEFHWLFRDRLDNLPALGPLTAGTPAEFTASLTRSDWDLDTLYVIAFVQNNTSKTIVQAGINSTTAHAPALLFTPDHDTVRPTLGGDRP